MTEILGPFPTPFDTDDGPYPRSLLELRLLALSAAIRRKPDWDLKRLKPDVVARWKEEAMAQHITQAQFQVIFDELEIYDKFRCGCIEVADVDGVWKAPGLIPRGLASQFSQLVDQLSNVPDEERDWHPGSDEKVLDLIHPSLYLFVSGTTRTITPGQPNSTKGVPTSLPEVTPRRHSRYMRADPQFSSAKYQWIPTPVEVDASEKVRFLSYINNLHPGRYSQLYEALSNILAAIIPAFERVLGFLRHPRRPKINLSDFGIYDESCKSPRQSDSESDEAFEDRWENYWENRPMKPIPVDEYTPIQDTAPISLSGRKLQVITKIQEIHLTPEKPSYEGGVWHVEGMKNEGIVASSIYYYDSTNVTECALSFREAVGEPEYEQNDNRGVEAIYGLVDEGPLVQNLGSVATNAGLVLAWPNIYQHRVSPFELVDPTKPGKRGILVFWLVDPDNPMEYDTSNVPPQQRDWWLEEVEQNPVLTSKLPQELRDLIFNFVDDPMPLEVAKAHRLKSMNERKYIRDDHNSEVYEREFSLCEH